MGTAAVFFAPGFEEIEAVTIVDVLRRAGIEVTMVGVSDLTVTGSHDVPIHMDALLEQVDPEQFDAVILPGGMPGARNLATSDAVCTFLQETVAAGGLLGAICAAPIALAAAGLLDGRTVTCYPSFREQLGACHWTASRVHEDNGLITGQGPGAALEFSLALVTRLAGPGAAADLASAMLVKA
jgi:4-methyl-5(b-hydroxyethyl)-thiazole monophosphate biosynthesis